MPNDIEQDRFVKYHEFYKSNKPKDPEPPLEGAPTTGAARSTKSMTSRKARYGQTGMSKGSQTGKHQ